MTKRDSTSGRFPRSPHRPVPPSLRDFKRKLKAEAQVEVRVVELEPFIVTERRAAELLGEAVTTFRRRRIVSRALVEAGKPPLGPRWIVYNDTGVRYEIAELRRWLKERSVECGRTIWRGDHPRAPRRQTDEDGADGSDGE